MKLKTKILTVLSIISLSLGTLYSSFAHASVPNTAESAEEEISRLPITTTELQNACNSADFFFQESNHNSVYYSILAKCTDPYNAFQICKPGRRATFSEIHQALETAINYLQRTNDDKFVYYTVSYIAENHIELSHEEYLKLIQTAIIAGDFCADFINFLLAKCHVDIDFQDPESGATALHTAVLFARPNIIKALLNNHANTHITNRHGQTPYTLATLAPEFITLPTGKIVPTNIRSMVNIFRQYGITR